MAVTFGTAAKSDVSELVELRVAYLSEDFGELTNEQVASLPDELIPYFERHLNKDLFVFVARDERIVACAWLLLVEKPPSPRFPHGRTGVLFNVYTQPDRRHRGLASSVMRELIDAARTMQLDVIELNATDDGYPLYLSLGFADDSSTHKAMRLVL